MKPAVAVALLLLGVGAGGCATNRSPIHQSLDEQQLRETVRARFVVGQHLQEVEDTLDDMGMPVQRRRETVGTLASPHVVAARVQPPGFFWTAGYSGTRWDTLEFYFDKDARLESVVHTYAFDAAEHDPRRIMP